jgi:hypothetical protein
MSPSAEGSQALHFIFESAWQEIVSPLVVLEFVSGDGQEERDRTPFEGKFWVYEQAIRVPFYGIYEAAKSSVEVYHLVDGYYRLLLANERGHFPFEPLGVELGIWQGHYQNADLPWLRWWNGQGDLLLTGEERADQAESLLEQERLRVERLAEQLRALGADPDRVG